MLLIIEQHIQLKQIVMFPLGGLNETFTFMILLVDVPVKCKSSPSSPMKTTCKMDRSALSCDHRVSSLLQIFSHMNHSP